MVHTNGMTNGLVNGHSKSPYIHSRLYNIPHESDPDITELITLCSQITEAADYPQSCDIVSNIPIYDVSTFSSTSSTLSLQDEWHKILHSGPGVFILRNFFTDLNLIDRATTIYNGIIASEASSSSSKGDHFAASGNNARIWNSFSKHALADPSSFIQYYASPWLSAVCEAWLGPGYQITAQVNIVRPGGKPQTAHRDYHLGFQSLETSATWPKTMHYASQFLTLQGAVAHSDMPLESGPTRLLPFSQMCGNGYLLSRTQKCKDWFDANWVTAELKKGDAVFFNPALIHAAGENRTEDVQRCANLLQISSAFGRAMETVDRIAVVEACWEELTTMIGKEKESVRLVSAVKSVTEGYSFPTNLDNRAPSIGGMAPESETGLVMQALRQKWRKEQVIAALRQMREDSQA